ncbi:glycosyltransferase family 2 protein [Echinicola soli]|uniref:Glycosyltransferase family 2 protein n=1 Tax=Echinicola soli TaxID=2591634 RepID=A0A514CJ03_9BACT|nr:glycosyltransferase family 2 protein [Echinicola soli]QDH79805.1 glycosyltransferase family 2 protein [Echinicola soli]
MPLISVIIPTYNRANVLPRAIKSVVDQTYTDWELIIVDDGSNDETKSVVDQFLFDERINYVYQENKGVSAARNYGAEKASGEYLIFLDSDDELLPYSLLKYAEKISKGFPLIVFSKYFKGKEVRGIKSSSMFFKNIGVSNIPGAFCLRKNLFFDIGGYNVKLLHSENWELMIRACHYFSLGNDDISYVKYPLLQYNDWCTLEKLMQNKKNKIKSYKVLYEEYRQNNTFDNSLYLYFAHVVAMNYGGLGKIKLTMLWTFKSVNMKSLRIRYMFKPLLIFMKRRIIPY